MFPATEDRAVRVDLFGDEIESLRWFSTFTQRSLGDADLVEIAPAAELAEEHRELAEIAALEDAADRPDIAELLPVEDFHPFLELAPEDASVLIAGEEDVAPALADHWQDVCAAFHDTDAHHLYVSPDEISPVLEAARPDPAVEHRPGSAVHVPRPDGRRRRARGQGGRARAREAEPLGLPDGRHVRPPRRGRARGLQPRAAEGQLAESSGNGAAPAPLTFAHARLQVGFIAPQFHLAVIPEHRLFRRRRAAERPDRARRRGVLRSFTDLRTGDIVVHEDHGVARFAGFDTKTVAGVTRDYLYLEYAGSDRVFVPVDQLAKISRFVGAGARTRRCPSSAATAGTRSRRGPGARPRSSPASCSTCTRSASAARATRSRPTPTGSVSSRMRSRSPRHPTSATRSSSSRPTWRRHGRWTD